MGMLIDGKWNDSDRDPRLSGGGRFTRSESVFRNWVTADGAPGPSGEGGFKAEPDRYLLYVCHACPWAHRTTIMRKLKGLEKIIPLSVVHWYKGPEGWSFDDGPGVVPDPINNARFMHQVYTAADPSYTGRVTVPVLWDKERATIVNNESSEIIRMFNSAFDEWADTSVDYYPEALRDEIDAINDPVYNHVNNGVYKSGFATSQEAYDEAVTALFETLDRLEARLGRQRYLAGDQVTEADWRLFTTLVRFDPVYHGHFKCNLRRIYDYPNLWNYAKELYQVPGVAETVFVDICKMHYYGSHLQINPTGIVPKGPIIDYSTAHDRGRLPKAA